MTTHTDSHVVENISVKWLIWLALIMTVLFLLSCAQGDKQARAISEQPARDSKVTPPSAEDNALRMGIAVRVLDTDKLTGERIGQQFDRELKVFESCMKLSKTEIVRVKARWAMAKDGSFTEFKVLESVPSDKPFVDCFSKQINKLQFKSEKIDLRGEFEFQTFWGAAKDWSEQKRLEKGAVKK